MRGWVVFVSGVVVSSQVHLLRDTFQKQLFPYERIYEPFFANGRPEEWRTSNYSWKSYPFKKSQFEHAITQGTETVCGFKHLVSKLEKGLPVKIVVLGGSVSYGTNCESPVWGRRYECNWVVRVNKWLAFRYPSWDLEVVNYSHGGWGASHFLNANIPKGDAYIIETSVNYCIPKDVRNLIRLLPGPKIGLVFFKTCSSALVFCQTYSRKDNRAPIVVPSTTIPRYGSESGHALGPIYLLPKFFEESNQLDSVYAPNVTMVSLRKLIWPVMNSPRPDIGHLWNGLIHPDSLGHEFISHLVEYTLIGLLEPKNETLECEILPRIQPVCPRIKYDLDANRADSKAETSIGWSRYRDVEDKYGFISDVEGNPKSEFTVTLPLFKVLFIDYLQTYQNITDAHVSIEGCNQTEILFGTSRYKMSIPRNARFSVRALSGIGKTLPCMKKSNSTRVTICAPLGKFKLLRIWSC